MKKSIMKNYLYNLAYQILIIIMPIITTPYLSRTLGASGIGTYSYTISIVTYFILFGSFGTAIYGQREVAYVQDDTKKKKYSILRNTYITLYYNADCYDSILSIILQNWTIRYLF